MNEPHRGFINLHSPYRWNPNTDRKRHQNTPSHKRTNHRFLDLMVLVFLHDCPTFIESLALADGHPQSIDVYTPIWPIPSFRFHRRNLTPKLRAWKKSSECIWKDHGIWEWDSKKKKPIVLKPKYFNIDPKTGKEFDFYGTALYPFVRRFASRVQRSCPDALIFVGPIPNEVRYILFFSPNNPQSINLFFFVVVLSFLAY